MFCHILVLSKLSCGLFNKVFDKVNLIEHDNNHRRGEVSSFLNLIDMESRIIVKRSLHFLITVCKILFKVHIIEHNKGMMIIAL